MDGILTEVGPKNCGGGRKDRFTNKADAKDFLQDVLSHQFYRRLFFYHNNLNICWSI